MNPYLMMLMVGQASVLQGWHRSESQRLHQSSQAPISAYGLAVSQPADHQGEVTLAESSRMGRVQRVCPYVPLAYPVCCDVNLQAWRKGSAVRKERPKRPETEALRKASWHLAPAKNSCCAPFRARKEPHGSFHNYLQYMMYYAQEDSSSSLDSPRQLPDVTF